jgi:hypothetical protein
MDGITEGQLVDFLNKDITRVLEFVRRELKDPLKEAKPIEYFLVFEPWELREPNRTTVKDKYLDAITYLAILVRNNRLDAKRVTVQSYHEAGSFGIHVKWRIEQ